MLSEVADEAKELVVFLAFLAFFLAGLAELSDEESLEAAGVDEGVVEGVWANAEAANRVATRAAISFFMFNPLRSLTSAIQANQVE